LPKRCKVHIIDKVSFKKESEDRKVCYTSARAWSCAGEKGKPMIACQG
jgi:hypothetical protein